MSEGIFIIKCFEKQLVFRFEFAPNLTLRSVDGTSNVQYVLLGFVMNSTEGSFTGGHNWAVIRFGQDRVSLNKTCTVNI